MKCPTIFRLSLPAPKRAFCTKWSHGKISAILDGKKRGILHWDIEKKRKVKLDRLKFFCVRIYYILLPFSMVDFVLSDQLVQKAHSDNKIPFTNLSAI